MVQVLLQATCPSWYQTNSIKALKETQNTDPRPGKNHSSCLYLLTDSRGKGCHAGFTLALGRYTGRGKHRGHLLRSGSMLWYPASARVFKSAVRESMDVWTSFNDRAAESQLCLTANDVIFSNRTASCVTTQRSRIQHNFRVSNHITHLNGWWFHK